MSLTEKGPGELAALVRDRQASAVEVTRAFLARIDAVDGDVHSYLLVDHEGALLRAGELDRALARGEDLGPLGGVPVAVKDMFVTRGLATTAGSKILAGWVPPYDGTAVARLRQAGAVLLGKLNQDEFAMGSSSENAAVPCRNPWNLDYVPGGSSGGSAASVAADLAAASLGTDTGGSIRQPASFCGVTGLRPTYGRVSRQGVVAFASSLDQVGPLARTALDTALVLECIAGHDPLDATSIPTPVPRYRDALAGDLRGLRLGVPDEYFTSGIDPEVEAAVRAAIDVLAGAGAELKRVRLPHTEHAVGCYYLICTAEAASNLARYDGVRYGARAEGKLPLAEMMRETRGAGFGPEVKRRIMLGTYVLRSGYYDAYYRKAQQVRALITRDFTVAFADVDAVVCPTAPSPAFRVGEKTDDPLSMYLADIFTISCNLAGLPGMSLPCGLSSKGLPIGLQLIGPPLGEPTLFRAGAAYQRLTDWHARRPPLVRS